VGSRLTVVVVSLLWLRLVGALKAHLGYAVDSRLKVHELGFILNVILLELPSELDPRVGCRVGNPFV